MTKEEAEGSLTFTIRNTTTGKYLTIAADGTAEWKKADKAPELTFGQLGKLKGYSVTGNAKNGFLFTVVLDGVEPGKYTISEMNSAIEGYKLTASSSVTSGSAEIAAGKKATIDLKDDYTKEEKPDDQISITVIRIDEVTGKPVVGVKLQLIDSEGNVIHEWITDGKPHTITGLKPGSTYIIHEAETPDGVKPAPDVTVTVDEDGTVHGVKVDEDGNVVVEAGLTEDDIKVSFKISKVDEQGNPLAGAEFVLKDSNGNKLAEWKSEKTATDISSRLNPGKTYLLEETKAPDGYEIGVKQYKIIVGADGTVKVDGVDDANIKDGVLKVVNKKISVQPTVTVTPTPTPTSGSAAGTSGSSSYYSGYSTSYSTTSTGGVRTGDDTNTMLFVFEGLAAIALFAMAAVVLKKRRRR